MKKTVVYDYQTFVNQKYGGISRYFCELATRVNKTDGFSTKVLAPAYINQYLKSIESDLASGCMKKTDLTLLEKKANRRSKPHKSLASSF